MEKGHYSGVGILLVILAIVAFGGDKNSQNPNGFFSVGTKPFPQTSETVKNSGGILDVDKSEFYGKVEIQQVNRSNDPKYEYVTLKVSSDIKKIISTEGWIIRSLSSGSAAEFPKGADLYFQNMINANDPILLFPDDTVYIVTGYSPNGSNFRLNKCSGYLNQFQTYIPYLYSNCPSPRNEDLSSIPNNINNDSCFDYIDGMSQCRTQTNIPNNLSYECKKFITDKINYNSCVDTHKSDKDFYSKEWRIYLRRNDHIWKDRRENIVLYDKLGKIIDEIKY